MCWTGQTIEYIVLSIMYYTVKKTTLSLITTARENKATKCCFLDRVVAIHSSCFDWIVLFWNRYSAIDKVQFLVGVMQDM